MDTPGEIDNLVIKSEVISQKDLFSLLAKCTLGVAYEALSGEVPFTSLFPDLQNIQYVIEPKKNINPETKAKELSELVSDNSAFILIPGQKFDAYGTRHGRGGGWYDRFLSAVPRSWVRVGICYTTQFSSEKLKLETWDKSMDFLCVVDSTSLEVQSYKVSSILS